VRRQGERLVVEHTALDCEADATLEPAVGRDLVCTRFYAANDGSEEFFEILA
jgi:hypothetical protein